MKKVLFGSMLALFLLPASVMVAQGKCTRMTCEALKTVERNKKTTASQITETNKTTATKVNIMTSKANTNGKKEMQQVHASKTNNTKSRK